MSQLTLIYRLINLFFQPNNYNRIQQRNFLRFGKRKSPLTKSIEDENDEEQTNLRGLNRRDYREFVRFGRKKKMASNKELSNVSYENSIQKRRDDFLRFGKSHDKKSNDFLRFG